MKSIAQKVAAFAIVGAVSMTGLISAQSAIADPIGGTPTPTITITPTTGSSTANPMLTRLQTNVGCPAGFRNASATAAFQGGNFVGAIADSRFADTAATDGNTGLTGQPMDLNRDINPSNTVLSNVTVGSLGLQVGDWELRVYCIADFQQLDFAVDKWISLPMTLNATGTWAVKSAVVTPPPATSAATTTSLTALPNQTAKTVALTATVKTPDTNGTVATAATGSVQFTQNGANIGSPVTVANGVATYTTPALADGSYTFTSVFTPTGTAYSGSTSGVATAGIGGTPPQTDTAVVSVTVPFDGGSVSFAGLRDAISLGTATLTGGFFTASGSLGGPSNASPIVITDTRQEGSTRWSLTGTVSDFVTSGGKMLDGKYLGWTPALVAPGPNAGTAGPAVAPAPTTVAGLKAPASVLSTGLVVPGVQTTTVDAALNLIAPSTTAGGFYTSTLTLTLVS